jgi:zinc transport system substrate-binding protein
LTTGFLSDIIRCVLCLSGNEGDEMKKPAIYWLSVCLFFISCSSPVPDSDSGKPLISVSILPQKYFVQRIVGDRFEVNVMIPPGHSPATYAPVPQQMRTLNRSKLYFRIGHIPFEKAWMENIAANNKTMKVFDTSVGVDLIKAEGEDHQNNDHKHNHTGVDPHIWLSPEAVKILAKHILDAVIETDRENRQFYETNYREFVKDVDRLDREIKDILKGCRGKKFMVFHPSWSYFARDYHLDQLAIEVEGKEPAAADLKKAVDIAKKQGIHVIFVQEQFDTNSARAVAAEINGRVIPMDPLAEDWLTNMKKIAQTLGKNLSGD